MGMARDYLNQKASKYLKSDDKESIGIGGYIAGVRIKEDMTYTSTVTTNTVEDGASINDHIINNPIILNIEGEIGDVEKIPDPILQAYKKIPKNVGVIAKYLPKKTQGQISKLNSTVLKANDILNKVDSIIDDGMQIYRIFKPLSTIPEQQMFFNVFEGIYNTKQLIDVEMPFKTYRNMALISLTIGKEGGNYLSYKMTFQEVRFAKLKVAKSGSYIKKVSSKSKSQVSKKSNKGLQNAKNSTASKKQSLLSKLTGG